MAFSDLITKDIAAPLGGFDKAVATGFELAQNQEKIGLAQQQNQLEQEKLKMSFIDKANSILPSLLKSRGAARKILSDQYKTLSAKGGVPVNEGSFDIIMSASQEDLAKAYQNCLKIANGDQVAASLMFRQAYGAENPEAATFIEKTATQAASAQAAMSRSVYQQGQVAARQKLMISEGQLKSTEAKLEKDISTISKPLESIAPKIKMVENVLGTPGNPIKGVQLSEVKALFPAFAKTVAGEVGVLTEGDVNRVFENTLGFKLADWKNYITAKENAPEQLVSELRERMALFKQSISQDVISKLNQTAVSARRDPRVGRYYDLNITPDGDLNVGFAYGQMVDKANNLMINNGLIATRRLNKETGRIEEIPKEQRVFNVQSWLKSPNRAGKVSQSTLDKAITQALSQGKKIILPEAQRIDVGVAPMPQYFPEEQQQSEE